MSTASVITEVAKSSPYLVKVSLSLFWTYATLSRKVGKARKAFEKELAQQGMSKKDAERLSECFEDLKNDITGMLKHGVMRGGSS